MANDIFTKALSMGPIDDEWSIEEQTDDQIIFKGAFGHAAVSADGKVTSKVSKYVEMLEAAIKGEELPVKPKAATKTNGQANTSIAARKPVGEVLVKPGDSLTLEKVREYFCKTATDEECAFALEVCAIRGLNPFKRDCFFIKYGGADPKLEIVVSKDFFMKKAMTNPDFQYFKAGVTVQRGEEVQNVDRYYAYPGETLLGGWAETKRRSIEVPFRAEIPLSGFKKDNKFWNSQPGPGHMIRKCAGSIVLREAFAEDFSGLYDEVEMGIDPEKEIVGGGKGQ